MAEDCSLPLKINAALVRAGLLQLSMSHELSSQQSQAGALADKSEFRSILSILSILFIVSIL